MAVPYTFGSATTSIPLSQLDSNFATAITLGNTAVQLGNTITSLTGVSNVASATSLSLGTSGNTTAVTIDTSQNVGIGTSSPAVRLNVTDSSDGGNSGTIRLGSDGTYYGQQQFRYNSSEYRFGVYPSGNMTFYTKGSESMRINSSGYVGIGTTSPETKVQVEGTADTVGATLRITSTGVCSAGMAVNATGLFFAADTGGFVWKTGAQNLPTTTGTERMRIDSSGNLLVGTTTSYSSEKVTINQSTSSIGLSVRSNGGPSLGNYESSDTGHNAYWTFGRDNASTGNFVFASGGTLRGSINSSTGTYTASSDLRLKKNITNITYGLNEVMAMRPVTYLMNEEEDTAKKHLGFIAQEVKALIDESVDDLIDPDTQFYMMDKGGLVPVLVKAIQEQQALITAQAETINALTARVVALESK